MAGSRTNCPGIYVIDKADKDLICLHSNIARPHLVPGRTMYLKDTHEVKAMEPTKEPQPVSHRGVSSELLVIDAKPGHTSGIIERDECYYFTDVTILVGLLSLQQFHLLRT
jgi:hypothetical protein